MIFALNDVYRNDECLADREMNRVSLNKDLQSREGNETEYELFSDRFHKFYPTYVLDANQVARSGPESLTINFNQLKDLLLSKDLSRLSELDWISQQNLRFLDGSVDMKGNVVALMSYPRSGNTFLRQFLERCTGIWTGSDMNLKHILPNQVMGMAGEQVVGDNTVWVTKTHHALESPLATKFTANRQICIVRNPIDVFPSFLYLINSGSHSLVPKEKVHEEF